MRIAVIGSGISGSLVARLLSTRHQVMLYEAADYAGGHAKTVDIDVFGRSLAVDTGFMVFNRRTYPNFCRLLDWLEITSRPSDMSFSVSCERSGLEYQGSSINGLLAQRCNVLRPGFWRMLGDIVRFNRLGQVAAGGDELGDGRTVDEFLSGAGLGSAFREKYLVPMASAIWSSNPKDIGDFPAEFMVRFFANHGLLQLRDRPQWRTILSGSRKYVTALLEPIWDQVHLGCGITGVRRSSDGVEVTPRNRPVEQFDHVVFATHADQTLRILQDASPAEQDILGAFPYHKNEAVLHTDTSILPGRRRAWASWNYRVPAGDAVAASVTYDLSRLQGLETPSPVLLTLNDSSAIDPGQVLQSTMFHHPAYSVVSLAAQRRQSEISGHRRTHFCGAYWGYGFHEDGVNSALGVARHFGIEFDQCTAASTKESSVTTVASR